MANGPCRAMCSSIRRSSQVLGRPIQLYCKLDLEQSNYIILPAFNPSIDHVKLSIDRLVATKKPSMMVIFYDTLKKVEDKFKDGDNTFKIIGLIKGVPVVEHSIEDFDQERLSIEVLNLIKFSENWDSTKNIQSIFNRYIYCSAHLKDLQRMITVNGVLMTANPTDINPLEKYNPFPSSLIPYKLSSEVYLEMKETTKIQNRLWAKMTHDHEFLLSSITKLESSDAFVKRLADVGRAALAYPKRQKTKLIIARNDYMYNETADSFQQVEFNLIAAGLGVLSERFKEFHATLNRMIDINYKVDPTQLGTGEMFQDAFTSAFEAYGNSSAIIVFITDRGGNTFSQEASIPELLKKGIKVKKYLFEEINSLGAFDEETAIFSVAGEEVAVFYFRNGYLPEQYSEDTWKLRENIEKSKAIKCPDVFTQIVNLKYFQYLINFESTWKRQGFSSEEIERNMKHFCKIFIFENFKHSKQELLRFIEEEGGPKNYVLKPQREGGANNYYGDEIIKFIEESTDQEIDATILMEKIWPTVRLSLYTDYKKVILEHVVSEIGIFSWSLSDDNSILFEGAGDYLVRSKKNDIDEGGINTGFAFLDSVEFFASKQ